MPLCNCATSGKWCSLSEPQFYACKRGLLRGQNQKRCIKDLTQASSVMDTKISLPSPTRTQQELTFPPGLPPSPLCPSSPKHLAYLLQHVLSTIVSWKQNPSHIMFFSPNAVLTYSTLHTKETKFPQGFRNISMNRLRKGWCLKKENLQVASVRCSEGCAVWCSEVDYMQILCQILAPGAPLTYGHLPGQ